MYYTSIFILNTYLFNILYIYSIGCLQSYLFNGGPLSVEDCHNYACQLFDALDFLHTKINLVHSDIKRELCM